MKPRITPEILSEQKKNNLPKDYQKPQVIDLGKVQEITKDTLSINVF